jgi:hypothetical protein
MHTWAEIIQNLSIILIIVLFIVISHYKDRVKTLEAWKKTLILENNELSRRLSKRNSKTKIDEENI